MTWARHSFLAALTFALLLFTQGPLTFALEPQFQTFNPEEYAILTPVSAKSAGKREESLTPVLHWKKPADLDSFLNIRADQNVGLLTAVFDSKNPILKANFYLEVETKGGHLLVFPPQAETTLKPLKSTVRERMRFEVLIKKVSTPVRLLAVTADGKKSELNFEVTLPNYAQLIEMAKNNGPARNWSYSFGLGFSKQSFEQTGYPAVSQIDLSAKAGLTYQFIRKRSPPRFQLGISGYATLLPLSTQPSASYKARFYGANFRFTTLFYPSPRWVVGLSTGFYFATMGVGQVRMGYRNLSGPQVYPSLRYVFPSKTSFIASYVKFSPIASSFSLLSFASRELATGIQYGKSSRSWTWMIQYDTAKLTFITPGSTRSLNNTSHSLSFSLSK